MPLNAGAGTGAITGTAAGPTPFISNVAATYSGTLQSVTYEIVPKPGSSTRPLFASYSAQYLASTGALNSSSSSITVPVFGLYAGYANTVYIYFYFTDGSASSQTVSITTASYADPCTQINSPALTQSRLNTSDLNYDFFVLKDICSTNDPAIIDTDGNIRWVGQANDGTSAVAIYNNAIYLSDGKTGILQMQLTNDTVTKIGDYAAAPYNVTYTGHHNIDPGRNGLIVDVNTTTQTEAVDLEFDPATGAVLNYWDLGQIISAAMTAGGDDPTSFVLGTSKDWFHNNATAYNAADNTLIVSSRENFVIAVDYDTPADGQKKIHWILGDTTKAWYGYASLSAFALTPTNANTLMPSGQHAVSIDHNGNLLLFDNGYKASTEAPYGTSRTYSAVREYVIDTAAMTATAGSVYYSPTPTIYNNICGSVYDVNGTYLVDFPVANSDTQVILQGLGTTENLVFNLQYQTSNFCNGGWNAYPIPSNTFQFSGAGGTPSFSISSAPYTLSLAAPQSGQVAVNVTPQNGFSGSVGLTATGFPAGVTYSFSNASATGATLSITATNSAASGIYPITIAGTSGSLVSLFTLNLAVAGNTQPDFSVAVSPNSLAVDPGSNASLPVTVSSSTGYTNGVTLSISGLPNGVTANLTYDAANSITLTFSATPTAAAGTYTVSVNGTAGNSVHSANLNLTVNGAKYVPFLSSVPATALRNNYSGFVGYEFTVGSSPIVVGALGRYVAAASSGTHLVKLVTTDGVDVPGGSVEVALSASTPNQFQYVNLAQPLALAAKTSYYIVSQEVVGGDQWYDLGPVTSNDPAKVINAVYTDGANEYVLVNQGSPYAYVPVDFLYDASVTASSAAITTPAAGATLSGTAASLSGVVMAGTQLTISSVQFTVDGVNVGAALTAPPYNVTFDTTVFSSGSHTAKVAALDSGGTTTTSAGVPFVISNATSAAVTVPSSGATVAGKSVALSATATPALGLQIASVQFKIDGVSSGASLIAQPYTIAFDSTKVSDGSHSVTAVAVDSMGSVATSPTVTFTVNNAASSVVVTAPVTGANVSGAAVSLAATTTPGAGLAITDVQFKIDSVNVGAAVTAAPYTTTFDSTMLTNGSHMVTAVVLDSSQTATTSAAVPFTVSNTATAPTATALLNSFSTGALRNNFSGFVGMEITVHSSPISVTSLGRIYVSGNTAAHMVKLVQASSGADVPGGSVTVNVSSGTVGQFVYATLASPVILAANASYFLVSQEIAGADFWYNITPVISTSAASVAAPVYFDGRSYVTGAGLSNESYVPVNLLYGAVSSAPPAVTITAPIAGASVSGNAVNVTATASAASGATIANVQFQVDGANFGTPQTTTPFTQTLDTTTLANGAHALTAVATDSSGNSATSAAVNVTVGNTPATVLVTAPTAGSTITGTSVTISATATAANGLTIAKVQFQVDGTNLGNAITTAPFATVFNSASLTNGTHSLSAVATDSNGVPAASPAVSVTSSNVSAPPSASALLTGFTAGTLRNNFPGYVGMQLTVGSTAITVTALGRIYVAGNTASHTVKLVNASTGADVAGGSVIVTPNGTAGQFTYVSLASPVSLAANASYYLVSLETSGGDKWYDYTPVTGATVASGIAPVYYDGSKYVAASGLPNQSYVPVNLQYSTVAIIPPTVSITSPVSGATVSGSSVSVTASASAAAGLSIANVQFQVDGMNFGTPQTTTPFTQALDTTTLANGAHALTAVATDSSGNSATSAAVSVTVGNTPATVTLTAPTAGATITGTSVTISATATAANGLSIAKVQFQVDGTNLGNAITTAPYTTVFNSALLTNGTHSLTAVATDSNGVPAASPAVSVTSSNVSAPPSASALLTGFTAGTLRNNFPGYVGMQLTVGSTAITVTALGRIYVAGNTASHTVKLVNASTGADVAGGSVIVTPNGTAGQFTYVSLASPVSLAANASYYLVSLETSGGDKWYDYTPVTGATAASAIAPVYYDGSKYVVASGLPNQSYVPVNLQYSTAVSTAPTVSINSPVGGATVSGSSVSVTATATPSSGLSITSVQFYVDSVAIGSAVTVAPYSVFLDTTTLSNGTHALTALAQDSAGGATTSSAVSVVVSNGGGTTSGTSLLTGVTAGTLRNNYSGYVGMQFKVLGTPITVTSLGRFYLAGNTGTHVLKLVVASTGGDVPGGSVSVSLPSGTAGQFAYIALAAPLTLSANTAYYLVSLETSGDDNWYDITGIAGTTAASLDGPVYYNGFSYVFVGSEPNQSYVPLSLLYHF